MWTNLYHVVSVHVYVYKKSTPFAQCKDGKNNHEVSSGIETNMGTNLSCVHIYIYDIYLLNMKPKNSQGNQLFALCPRNSLKILRCPKKMTSKPLTYLKCIQCQVRSSPFKSILKRDNNFAQPYPFKPVPVPMSSKPVQNAFKMSSVPVRECKQQNVAFCFFQICHNQRADPTFSARTRHELK